VDENQIDQMPIDQLIELKGRIEKMIEARIKREREVLLRKLDAIRVYESMTAKSVKRVPHANGGNGKKKRRARPGPKYRDPETGATWTGRGMQPRWMRAAIREGKRPDDFLIPTEH
jgi:DNA-binding protein H-NS